MNEVRRIPRDIRLGQKKTSQKSLLHIPFMKRMYSALVILALAPLAPFTFAQESIADVLADPSLEFNRSADRTRAVQRIQGVENAGLERARAKANAMRIPMRQVLPDGTVTAIVGPDENDEFFIYTTRNANTAIFSAANLVYATPHILDEYGESFTNRIRNASAAVARVANVHRYS